MREFDLLRTIYGRNAALPERVTIPPGDDMGAVRIGDRDVLITVDQVIDGVHVDLANTPIAKVGRKAMTRNLSDVAAMAAVPVAAVAAVCVPRDFAHGPELHDALARAGAQYGCPLIGGDVSIWDGPMVVSVTVLAEPGDTPPVLRTGAQPGDGIYVTGQIGGSYATGHHLDFEPRLEAARKLAPHIHCLIDLSDGLARDLGHLVEHAEIEAAALPVRVAGMDWRAAVGDGEDYELLFCAKPRAAWDVGVAVTRVGTVMERGGRVVVLPDGTRASLDGLGWEHGS